MDVPTFVGISIFTNIYMGALVCVRIWALARRRGWKQLWSSMQSADTWSVATFAFACVLNMLELSYYIHTTMKEDRWVKDGIPESKAEARISTRTYLKVLFATGAVDYIFELYLTKAAFLFLYWDLYKHVQGKRRLLFYGAAVYTAIGFIVTLVYWLTFCKPISANWSTWTPESFCRVNTSLAPNILLCIFNLTSDLFLLVLPLCMLSSIRLRGIETIGFTFVFCMGFLSVGATIARIIVVSTRLDTEMKHQLTQENKNLYLYLDTLEKVSAYTAFCLPAGRNLLRNSVWAKAFWHWCTALCGTNGGGGGPSSGDCSHLSSMPTELDKSITAQAAATAAARRDLFASYNSDVDADDDEEEGGGHAHQHSLQDHGILDRL